MILCDLNNVYLLSQSDFVGRSAFNIRKSSSKNGQKKGMNFHNDYVISNERIAEVLS